MRIKLERGKQRKLIELSKKGLAWDILAEKLETNSQYLSYELRNELRLLSEDMYKKLCGISGVEYDKHILEKLNDNWGRSRGGRNSSAKAKGNTKKFTNPPESKELAELFGIILGDGHIEYYVKNKKVRCYSVKICGDLIKDYNYLSKYVSKLMKKTLGEDPKLRRVPKHNEIFVAMHGRKMIDFLNTKGLKSGNKKNNNQTIPRWILNNKDYLVACIRGLIDTDGSIHYIAKTNKNIRITFTSYIPPLLKEVRKSLIKLGFHPSKIIKENQIFLSRKEEINTYIEKIGFSNDKHLNRIKILKQKASMV